jgi:hypothetical protein
MAMGDAEAATDLATREAAALLAAEIENPSLHEQVRAVAGARIMVAAA